MREFRCKIYLALQIQPNWFSGTSSPPIADMNLFNWRAFALTFCLRHLPPQEEELATLMKNLKIGVTEILFLVGVLLLGVGVGMKYGLDVALIVDGAVLVGSALFNQHLAEKQS